MTSVYGKSAGKIVTPLLSMPECKSSCTGENTFDLIYQALKEQGLCWDYCVAYGSDNAAVMMGKTVLLLSSEENKEIYVCLGVPATLPI